MGHLHQRINGLQVMERVRLDQHGHSVRLIGKGTAVQHITHPLVITRIALPMQMKLSPIIDQYQMNTNQVSFPKLYKQIWVNAYICLFFSSSHCFARMPSAYRSQSHQMPIDLHWNTFIKEAVTTGWGFDDFFVCNSGSLSYHFLSSFSRSIATLWTSIHKENNIIQQKRKHGIFVNMSPFVGNFEK